MEYPQNLNERHNNYLLAPEKTKVEYEELSLYQKRLTLKDREKYVVPFRALRLYLELGMKLKKIHYMVSLTLKENSRAAKQKMNSSTQNDLLHSAMFLLLLTSR